MVRLSPQSRWLALVTASLFAGVGLFSATTAVANRTGSSPRRLFGFAIERSRAAAARRFFRGAVRSGSGCLAAL